MRRRKFPILALIPLLILALSITYLTGQALISPVCSNAPLATSLPQSSLPLDQDEEEEDLPYLLYSAADLPPLASEFYDILFAQNAQNPSLPSKPIPQGCFAVIEKNLCPEQSHTTVHLSNETAYTPDTHALSLPSASFIPTLSQGTSSDQPLVLILHSHGTEAYLDEDAWYVEAGESFRTTDPENNVVAVGQVLVETLVENGVSAIHCKVMHDAESYSAAYTNARQTIVEYLTRYPTIRYVLDVHRDALITTSGEHIRPITSTDKEACAQIMMVVGTDQNGANHPDWEDNLSLACRLQLKLNQAVEDFARPINLRKGAFNAQYAERSLLLEIGSAANTLSQAKTAAKEFGRVFAELIKNAS